MSQAEQIQHILARKTPDKAGLPSEMSEEKVLEFIIQELETWENLRFREYSIIDDATGIKLIPFTATDKQLMKVVEWELTQRNPYFQFQDPEQPARKSPHDIFTNDDVEKEYQKKLSNPFEAVFEIVGPEEKSVGVIGLSDINYPFRLASAYILIGRREQRKGIGEAATRLLFTLAQHVGFQKIMAVVEKRNTASLKLSQKFTSDSKSYPMDSLFAPEENPWVLFEHDLSTWKPADSIRILPPAPKQNVSTK